jgi:MraZ protein
MVFTDRFDHTIDEKNRLAIPSSIRSSLSDQGNAALYLVPEGRYLQLIPEKLFDQLSTAARAGLTVRSDLAKAKRLVFGTASRLEPDKAGRVVIPERYMADRKNRDQYSEAQLERQVTLVGVGDRVEVWNTSEFYSHLRELLAERQNVQGATEQIFGAVPPAEGPDKTN